MSGLLSPAVTGQVMDFDPYNTDSSTVPGHQYGSMVQSNHARDVFRFGKVGAANTGHGKLELAPAPIANHLDQSFDSGSNFSIGDKRLTLNNGGTASPAGIYDQGSLEITSGTGLGQHIGVLHSFGATSSADIVVDLDVPLWIAIVAGTTTGSLVHNPYNAFVESATKTRTAAGVGLIDGVAGGFNWLQTKGVVAVLIGSAATLGSRLTSDGSTAGAVTDNTDVTAPQAEVEIGQASIQAGTTAHYDPIVLSID